MEFVDLEDHSLDGLHGPYCLVGFAFWTDNGRIAWLLSDGLREFKSKELERELDREVPSFCDVAKNLGRWLSSRGAKLWDDKSDQSLGDRIVFKGGVLIGYTGDTKTFCVFPV